MLNGTNDTNAKAQSKMVHASCYQQVRGRPPKGARVAYTDGKTCFHCGGTIAKDTPIGWFRDNINGRRHGTGPKDAPANGAPPVTFPEDADDVPESEPAPAPPVVAGGVDLGSVLGALIETIVTRVEARIAPKLEKIVRDTSTVTRVHVSSPKMPEPKDMGVQHKQFVDLLSLIGPGDHVWMAGEAGTGKTHAAEQVAKALSIDFAYTGSVADKYEFSGFRDAHGVYHGTALRKVWEHGGLWVHDEADRSDNGALLALNACLSNGIAAFPDGMVPRHPECRIIVTANTIGNGPDAKYVGAARIDAAFRNRFFLLRWEHDAELELNTAPWRVWTEEVQAVRAECTKRGLRVMVTPRESYRGPRALARGAKLDVVRRATWGADMTDDQFRQVREAVISLTESDVRSWRESLPKGEG